MKSLVIAEKPSVARDIARVLHCNQKGNGVLEGKDYAVTWALGHLITLADPEEYDKKYMKWEMQTLPVMPDKETGRHPSDIQTISGCKDTAFPKRHWRHHHSDRCRERGRTCCEMDTGQRQDAANQSADCGFPL